MTYLTKKTSSDFFTGWKYKTHLCKFREDDFPQNFVFSRSGRQRVSRLRYLSRTTTTHADHGHANKLVHVFVLVLPSKALFLQQQR